MSLHSELLKQARFLARKEPKKPPQASLRRSVSASYCALFHLLVDDATKLMLSGSARGPLRDCLARAFRHSDMKQTAVAFTKQSITPKLTAGFNRQPVAAVDRCRLFLRPASGSPPRCGLQSPLRFTRREVLDIADMTEQAFLDWQQVRGTLQGRYVPHRAARLQTHAGMIRQST